MGTEQSTMIALTLFASQSKQIIIKILDLKDILGLYCGIKVVIQCQIVDFTLSQYIVTRIAIRPCLSQYIAIHFWVAIPIPNGNTNFQVGKLTLVQARKWDIKCVCLSDNTIESVKSLGVYCIFQLWIMLGS